MRENILNLPPLYFNGCGECHQCCEDKFFLAPLILEDFKKVKPYFEIRAIILEDIIPVMLLTDGKVCKYLQDGKCKIYDVRPPACRIYPFSPYFDDILVDLSCDAVGEKGIKLPSNKEELFRSDFFEERLINFTEKRERTIQFMKNKKLIFDKTIKDINLYKFELTN